MDPNQRTSGALLDRANANVAQLLRRFENIIAYTAGEKHDRVSAAVGAYQMEVETAALVKAAEDILSLTRTLKETWLFGKLQTVGTSEAKTRAQAAAAKVTEGLEKLYAAEVMDVKMRNGEDGGSNGVDAGVGIGEAKIGNGNGEDGVGDGEHKAHSWE